MKVKKTFRIDEKTASELEEYANKKNVSQTEALEGAIHKALHVPYVKS